MPVKAFSQGSMFDPQTISPGLLTEGSLPWVLVRVGDALVPGFLLFRGSLIAA